MCDMIRQPSIQRQQPPRRDGSPMVRAGMDAVPKARDERTPRRLQARLCTALLAALYALGCSSSQVAPDYAGEPLAVLQGALSADDGFGVPPAGDGMSVGLVWLVSSPNGEKSPLVAETAQTEGEFPFGFRLTIFSPPTPEAQSCPRCSAFEPNPDVERSPVYQGLVAALDDGADLERVTMLDILGVSLDYGVLYFERDANAEDPGDEVGLVASHYNVPAVQGYHLYRIQKDFELYAALRRCEKNGLCVESRTAGGEAARAWTEAFFEECLELVPDALTCTLYPPVCPWGAVDANECVTYFDERGAEPTAAELAEDERCTALMAEHFPPAECGTLESPWQFPGNPLGFDANISIRLGAGLFEWIN